jgi:centractin
MSAEFEDVLTNQPVVIDNVRAQFKDAYTFNKQPLCADNRALGPLKLDLQVKITQNVSSPPCAFQWLAQFCGKKIFLRNSVGRPKHIRVMAGALEGDVFIGRKAQEFRGLLKIKYPMEHGIVTDWDDMERIWSWVYAEELGTLSEEASAPNLFRLRSQGLQSRCAASSSPNRSTTKSSK